MTKYLVLDFETVDPYIARGMGAGWVYPLHVPTSDFRVIGFSYQTISDGMVGMTQYCALDDIRSRESNFNLLSSFLHGDFAVIMHNSQYDLGCLLSLGIDISKLKVFDTKIMAQLYDNTLPSYSLDFLSKKYLPESQQKKQGSLADVVRKHELLRSPSGSPADPDAKTYNGRALKWAYQHMDIIQEKDFEAMAFYAKQDVIATANLFKFFVGEEL